MKSLPFARLAGAGRAQVFPGEAEGEATWIGLDVGGNRTSLVGDFGKPTVRGKMDEQDRDVCDGDSIVLISGPCQCSREHVAKKQRLKTYDAIWQCR